MAHQISLLDFSRFGRLSSLRGRDSCMPWDFKLQFPCCS